MTALSGIHSDASPALVWRAVLEAATRETHLNLAAIESVAGNGDRLVVTGGWARSAAFRAVKEEVLGPFDYPAVNEAGCRGAALLAGCAAGIYDGIDNVPPPLH